MWALQTSFNPRTKANQYFHSINIHLIAEVRKRPKGILEHQVALPKDRHFPSICIRAKAQHILKTDRPEKMAYHRANREIGFLSAGKFC